MKRYTARTPLAKFIADEQRRALENTMYDQMAAGCFPEPVREFPFARSIGRKWKADFAWKDRMILLEVEGGTYSKGRHVRPLGYRNDCEKYSVAAALGWKVIRVTTDMIADGTAIRLLEFAFYGGAYEQNHRRRTG